MLYLKFVRIILIIGMIEFRGVLSSWAIEEKYMARIFWEVFSSCLTLVISLKMAINCVSLLISEAFI
jgi:hypothetical protein